MDIQLARLMVLYEDLRLEVLCAAMDATATSADTLGEGYRQLYFIRRAFATLDEFDGAFHQLNMDVRFKTLLRSWPTDDRNAWAKMIKFFCKEKTLLTNVRNAVGGHFSNQAAGVAIREVTSTEAAVARLEFVRDPSGRGAGPRFHMAALLVANALLKEKNDGVDDEVFLRELFGFIQDALTHAAKAMHLLTERLLLPRFQ